MRVAALVGDAGLVWWFCLSRMLLRNTPALRIENIWMNVYLGGSRTTSFDLPLQMAHGVIARRYIGPRAA